MTEGTTKKVVHNVAVRVQDGLYRSVKRTFADTDENFQSLIVRLLTEYVSTGVILPSEQVHKRKISEIPDTGLPKWWHNTVALVLENGNAGEIKALKELLTYLGEVVGRQAPLIAKDRSSGPGGTDDSGDGRAESGHSHAATGTKGKHRR